MEATLYFMGVSHPSHAARAMLRLKGIPYRRVDVLPLNQRIHLRLAGFRGGTVPALKLDGRRIQGSRQISAALDEHTPDPPLFPRQEPERARVQEAERWGDQQLQPVPRRLARYGAARRADLRVWGARSAGMPAPELIAALTGPMVSYYARTVEADGRRGNEAGGRADLDALPAGLARIDALLADGTLTTDPPNAATLQILSTVRVLDAFEDLHTFVSTFECARPARALFPDYPGPVPSFLPEEWVRSALTGQP